MVFTSWRIMIGCRVTKAQLVFKKNASFEVTGNT